MTAPSRIGLKQHFFTSARAGLGGSCGLQTVARSAGLEAVESVTGRFRYHLPGGGGGPPVNWAWFYCEDVPSAFRVCVTRACDAGADFDGRAGAFFAHSFFLSRAALRAIDYDVPALLRWARDQAPAGPPSPGDGRAGFVHHLDGLHARFGTDPAALASVPPLAVPVAEVRRLREQSDRRLGEELRGRLGPVWAALGPGGVAALLRAYLCPPGQRRPVLVLGPPGGAAHGEFGLALADLLFTLLPGHCRRELTFATYVHPRDAAEGGGRGAEAACRVLMTPGTGEFVRPGASRAAPWVVDAGGRHRPAVPDAETPAAHFVARCLEAGDAGALLRARDFAARFDFRDEADGLATAAELVRVQQGEAPRPAHYELFARAAPLWLPDQPSAPLLNLAARLNGAGLPLPADYVASCLALLQRELPRLWPRLGARSREFLLGQVRLLFDQVLRLRAWDLCQRVLRGLLAGGPDDLRASGLGQCLEVIRARVTENCITDIPDLWERLSAAAENATGRSCNAFLAQAQAHLCETLLASFPDHRDWLREQFDPHILNVLKEAPLADQEQKNRRLRFVIGVAYTNEEGFAWCKALREAFGYPSDAEFRTTQALLRHPLAPGPGEE